MQIYTEHQMLCVNPYKLQLKTETHKI